LERGRGVGGERGWWGGGGARDRHEERKVGTKQVDVAQAIVAQEGAAVSAERSLEARGDSRREGRGREGARRQSGGHGLGDERKGSGFRLGAIREGGMAI